MRGILPGYFLNCVSIENETLKPGCRPFFYSRLPIWIDWIYKRQMYPQFIWMNYFIQMPMYT